MFNVSSTSESVNTGTKDVAELLGGGILPDSLVTVIGESKTGKSVFCQHLAYNALQSRDSSMVYYTASPKFTDLLEQMTCFSMDIQHYFATDRFRIVPLSSLNIYDSMARSVAFLIECIEELSARFSLVIIDAITPYILKLDPKAKMDIFQALKRLCHDGRSIVVVSDSFALEKETLTRVYMMSDYYIRLKSDDLKFGTAEVDNRSIKLLNVRKLRGAENPGGESIKFEVKPEAGIQILPFIKVRI